MKSLALIVALQASYQLLAQVAPSGEFDPARLVDEVFAGQELDLNYQDLYENYLQLMANPLDLNSVTD